MPSKKARLYIALYVRGGKPRMPGLEDKYHWALLVGAKDEAKDLDGMKYHAKNVPGHTTWMFEARATSMTPIDMILVRVLVGKVANSARLAEKLRSVPIVNDDPNWNCVIWIQNALAAIVKDNVMGTSNLQWSQVSATTMEYCQRKAAAGRFSGEGDSARTRIPTFDLLQGKEVVP